MCSLERVGQVLILRLTGETEHLLGITLCKQIREQLAVAAKSDARALITTNDGEYFSNGLEVDWLKEDPENRVQLLLTELEGTVQDLMKLEMPTYAAICGHAVAAGFLFAMAHDHRFMRNDHGLLYSAAMEIKFVMPAGTVKLLRAKLAPKLFKDVLLSGAKFSGSMALEAGIVDSLHEDRGSTLSEAVNEAAKFCERPWGRSAYAKLRQLISCNNIRCNC